MVNRGIVLGLASSLWIALPSASRRQELAASVTPGGRADPATVALARQLLQVSHAGDNMLATVELSLTQQRERSSQLAPVFFDSAIARMKRSVPELLDSLAPV